MVAKIFAPNCYIHKFVNGAIRSKRYRVKLSEIYSVSQESVGVTDVHRPRIRHF